MAYDSANRKLYTTDSEGISTSEVAACLGDYRVTARGRDIGLLCTSPKVNPMARYKPEDYDTKTKLTEAQRKANGFGFGSKALYFNAGGSSVPHAVYQYVPPKGGSASPFRLLDFDGYYHKAVSPLFLDFPSKLYVDGANGVAIIANSTGKTNYNPDSCVKLGEVLNASSDIYVALYIFKDATHQWLLPTSVKVNDLSASTFPTIYFAGTESGLPAYSSTNRIYPYVVSDLEDSVGDDYTLIAVGVQGLTYSNNTPYAYGSSKPIGNRQLLSMELERDADRMTLSAVVGKVLTDLKGTFTPNFGTFAKYGTWGGYQGYILSSASSTLVLNTPEEWLFTSQDTLYVEMVVSNGIGHIYSGNGAVNETITFSKAVSLGNSGTSYSFTDLTSTIRSYYFTDESNSASVTIIPLDIRIRVHRKQDFSGEYVQVYNGRINISKS